MRLVTTEKSGTAKISQSAIRDYLKTAFEEVDPYTNGTNQNKFVAKWVRNEMLNLLGHLEANGVPAFAKLEYVGEQNEVYYGDILKDAILESNVALFWTIYLLSAWAEYANLDTPISRLVLKTASSIRPNL